MRRLAYALPLLALSISFSCGDGSSRMYAADASATITNKTSPRVAAVVEHHNSPERDGLYVVPNLTKAVAAQLRLLPAYPTYSGGVNAQPLYVPNEPSGTGGTYYVVTGGNDVIAIDEQTLSLRWAANLGPSVKVEAENCKVSVSPLGITGTPYLDLSARTLYVDSAVSDGTAAQVLLTHQVHALSIDDGTERSGWPVDVRGLSSNGNAFDPSVAGQRGAMALVNGTLYVPYASQGDCGSYRGAVMAVSVADPTQRSMWQAPGLLAGVWATVGVSSDGESIFFATGNSDVKATEWIGGEAVFRFAATQLKDTADDVFVASTWHALDSVDGDLGGSGVLLVTEPKSTPSHLAIVTGKDGKFNILDTAHFGGLGAPPLSSAPVATHDIVNASAAVPTENGTMVVFDAQSGGQGIGCPGDQFGDLVGVLISTGSPPTSQVSWCADTNGHGSPIITTSDGRNDAIVWVAVALGDGALRGYDALTGVPIYDSSTMHDTMVGLHRFSTLIAADGNLVVAADARLYVFGTP